MLSKKSIVSIEDIKEELRLIEESNTDYITPSGIVYKKFQIKNILKEKIT